MHLSNKYLVNRRPIRLLRLKDKFLRQELIASKVEKRSEPNI
jgi:hypothetical protein